MKQLLHMCDSWAEKAREEVGYRDTAYMPMFELYDLICLMSIPPASLVSIPNNKNNSNNNIIIRPTSSENNCQLSNVLCASNSYYHFIPAASVRFLDGKRPLKVTLSVRRCVSTERFLNDFRFIIHSLGITKY